ncbi:MAG: iron-containing alcohol dehydrogenase [Lachnospiraceae bacterium]
MAVIRNAENGMKMEFISCCLQPDVTVLDSRMTMTLPSRITASTGMDTFCHAIEAYTCIQKKCGQRCLSIGGRPISWKCIWSRR